MDEAEISMSTCRYPFPLVYVCTSFFPVRAGLLPTAILIAQLPSIICGIILNLLSQKLLSVVQNLRRSFFHAFLGAGLAVLLVVVVVVVEVGGKSLEEDAFIATDDDEEEEDDNDEELVVVVLDEEDDDKEAAEVEEEVEEEILLLSMARITFNASLLAVKRHTTCTYEAPGT